VRALPAKALSRIVLADLDREYSLSEIAIITSAGPARALGLSNKGHLGVGADVVPDQFAAALAHAGQTKPPAAGSPTFATAEARHRAALDAFLACYRDNLYVRSRLYPDAIATLDDLRSRGIQLCCITNKRYSFSEQLLRDAGVLDRFELLLGGDSLPEKKPSPLPLSVAAEKLGVPAAAAALVGDSHQDLRAARGAGYAFVLASYGYGKIDETELADSPRIRKFADLPRALGL
jgi:HAD superfamily hydrolase (TIGR01509 family)